jgi:hypothetical protein
MIVMSRVASRSGHTSAIPMPMLKVAIISSDGSPPAAWIRAKMRGSGQRLGSQHTRSFGVAATSAGRRLVSPPPVTWAMARTAT